MKQRKILCAAAVICLSVILFFALWFHSGIASGQDQKGSCYYGMNQISAEDLSGIQECESEMLEFLQDVIESSEGIHVQTLNAVDYTYLFKIYETGSLVKNIEQDLKEAAYSYVLDWCVNGTEYEITYSLGRQPREDVSYSKEEYKELVEHVGKWAVSSIGKIDADSTSYRAAVERYDRQGYDDVVICAGLDGFGWPVLIGISNHEAETIAPVYDESTYDVFSRPEVRAYKVNGDDMYDYDGIVQMMGEVHDGS